MYWYPAAVLSVRKVSANSHVLSHLPLQNDLKKIEIAPFSKGKQFAPLPANFG